MEYIVLDLEWNQAPDENSLPNIPFEIIEIGAVKLNSERKVVDTFCESIQPHIYPTIHYITQEITSFSTEDLANCRTFKEVMTDFLRWCGTNCVFCTWGAMDLTELQRNMHYHNIPLLPPPVFYYDIQKIFSIVYDDGKTRCTLKSAIEYLQIDSKHDFHRALVDAYYTTKIIQILPSNVIADYYSIDTYQVPTTRSNEIVALFDTYLKYISVAFDNKTDAMNDKTVTSMVCYKCGKRLRKKIYWFSSNSKIYYCLARCYTHGYVKGKIRMKKTDDGKYFAIKTIKITDDAGAEQIYKRQHDIRERRKKKRHKQAD